MSNDCDDSSLKSLTRAELRESVYSRLPQLSRSQISNLVDAVFEEMALAFLRDEPIKLRGFGTFKIRNKRQRIGRNPKTGVDAIITPRKVITFHASPTLVATINNGDEHE